MKVVIWTKDECPHCVSAKAFLKQNNIHFEERVLGGNYTREQFFEANHGAKTVPQIYIQDTHIGGYQDLLNYIEDTGFNNTGWSL